MTLWECGMLWEDIEKLVLGLRKIDKDMLELYSDACHLIQTSPSCKYLRHNLIAMRLRDHRRFEHLPFVNFVDNLLCFLLLSPHFPRAFRGYRPDFVPYLPVPTLELYSPYSFEQDKVSKAVVKRLRDMRENKKLPSHKPVRKMTEERKRVLTYGLALLVFLVAGLLGLIITWYRV